MTVTTGFAAADLAGVVLRPVAIPQDLAAMNQVANASRAAEGEDWATSYEQFQSFYEHLSNSDPASDVVVAERGRRVLGYGRAAWRDAHEGERLYEPVAFAHPEAPPSLLGAIPTRWRRAAWPRAPWEWTRRTPTAPSSSTSPAAFG